MFLDFTTSTYFYIQKKRNNSGDMSTKETIKIAKTEKVKKIEVGLFIK